MASSKLLNSTLVELADGLWLAEDPVGVLKIRAYDSGGRDWLCEQLALALPGRGATAESNGLRLTWLAPLEWIAIGSRAQVARCAEQARGAAARAVLVLDITAGSAVLRLSGEGAGDRLAAFVPIDLAPDAFAVGLATRTLFDTIPLFLDRIGAVDFRIVSERTLAPQLITLISGEV